MTIEDARQDWGSITLLFGDRALPTRRRFVSRSLLVNSRNFMRLRATQLALALILLAGCTSNSEQTERSNSEESVLETDKSKKADTSVVSDLPNAKYPGDRATGKSPRDVVPVAPPAQVGEDNPFDRNPVDSETPLFVDATQESGIDFTHYNGGAGDYTLAEITGAGGALFDLDNDGDLDVYLVQGAPLTKGQTPPENPRLKSRLYRNEMVPNGKVIFTDITDGSGADIPGYGMGVATGDFDGDGWLDLYVTNLGSNYLLKNNGDGSFTDVTEKSGTNDPRWSTSASFVDVDADGRLDLFVTNYVNFEDGRKRECFSNNSSRDYCGPDAYDPVSDRLLRNLGDGTFEDITDRSGIGKGKAAGLGVVAADFNGDNRVDIYVANDGDSNHLWLNKKSGQFENAALLSGVAVNRSGTPEASMGVDAADVDGDGDVDLFMTHIERESNTFYLNLGNGIFDDRTVEMGLHATSLQFTAFGTRFFDYDNDGWLDLLVLNGAVRTIRSLAQQGDPYPLHQRNQLFRNNGKGGFSEISQSAGPALAASYVSRGAAFGDVDNDGDVDVLICNNNGPARLLLNQVGNKNNWLGIRVVDANGRSDVLQARVEVVDSAETALWRRVYTDGSYCSANDPRIVIGLGERTDVSMVRVHWPDGEIEEVAQPTLGQYTTIRRGQQETTE